MFGLHFWVHTCKSFFNRDSGFSGSPLPLDDVFGLLTLPGVLLNMLIAIPVYAVMRDLARWVYPSAEVNEFPNGEQV